MQQLLRNEEQIWNLQDKEFKLQRIIDNKQGTELLIFQDEMFKTQAVCYLINILC